MHLYETINNFLLDKDFFISIIKSHLHLYGFEQVLSMQEKEIKVSFPSFVLVVEGYNFKVLKLTKNELLVLGIVDNLRIVR